MQIYGGWVLEYWVWEGDWGKEKADNLSKEDPNYSLESANILNYGKDVVNLVRPGVCYFTQIKIDYNGRCKTNFWISCVKCARKLVSWFYIYKFDSCVSTRVEDIIKMESVSSTVVCER